MSAETLTHHGPVSEPRSVRSYLEEIKRIQKQTEADLRAAHPRNSLPRDYQDTVREKLMETEDPLFLNLVKSKYSISPDDEQMLADAEVEELGEKETRPGYYQQTLRLLFIDENETPGILVIHPQSFENTFKEDMSDDDFQTWTEEYQRGTIAHTDSLNSLLFEYIRTHTIQIVGWIED